MPADLSFLSPTADDGECVYPLGMYLEQRKEVTEIVRSAGGANPNSNPNSSPNSIPKLNSYSSSGPSPSPSPSPKSNRAPAPCRAASQALALV